MCQNDNLLKDIRDSIQNINSDLNKNKGTDYIVDFLRNQFGKDQMKISAWSFLFSSTNLLQGSSELVLSDSGDVFYFGELDVILPTGDSSSGFSGSLEISNIIQPTSKTGQPNPTVILTGEQHVLGGTKQIPFYFENIVFDKLKVNLGLNSTMDVIVNFSGYRVQLR